MKIFHAFHLPLFLVLVLLPVRPLPAAGGPGELRGERVGWARLKTSSPYWFRHATGDPVLMQFFRESTSLNIDPTWYAADVEKLEQMCKYPLLFSQGVHMVDGPKGRENLAEYIRRGGFLLIDSCINNTVTPDPDNFLALQEQFLQKILPGTRVLPLPESHPVYRIYFKIPNDSPPHTYFNNIYDKNWHKHGLYGVFIESRLVGMISLSGLQCGWDRMIAPPGHDEACMRMLVNIYIYAMLQGG